MRKRPNASPRKEHYPLMVPRDWPWLRALTSYCKRRGLTRPEGVRQMLIAQGGAELAELYENEKVFEERRVANKQAGAR